jgi:hypothetical protein
MAYRNKTQNKPLLHTQGAAYSGLNIKSNTKKKTGQNKIANTLPKKTHRVQFIHSPGKKNIHTGKGSFC